MPQSSTFPTVVMVLGTGFFSGYCPFAPGTAGTLVGILFFSGFAKFSPLLYLLTTASFIFLAAWLSDLAEQILQKRDAPAIVIDEISGFLITMLWIPGTWRNVLVGFVLFRFFDIIKLFPARWVETRLPGGWGIVLDDVVAGIYSNAVLHGVLQWT